MARRTMIKWLLSGTMMAALASTPSISNGQSFQPNENITFTRTIPGVHDYFTDIELLNQDGQQKRLYNDLLKDKVVLVNVFYSTCDSECSLIMDRLMKIQQGLGDKLGREVRILTFSMDPTQDTSDKLKYISNDLNAKYGWEFLTSDQETMSFALSRFGLSVEDKTQHSNMFIIGNEASGDWQMASGFSTIDTILETVDHVMQDNQSDVHATTFSDFMSQ